MTALSHKRESLECESKDRNQVTRNRSTEPRRLKLGLNKRRNKTSVMKEITMAYR